MTKDQFLDELNRRLSNRPDKNDIINFYYEQITDRLENGETEAEVFADIKIEEILLSLNETDSFEKEKIELDIPEPIIYKDNKEESKMNQTVDNTKQEKKKEETPKQEASSTTELSGGRKFWYVMWFILTVLFCVAAVCLEVELVCMTISFIGVIVAGCALFTTSIGGALFINGIGLLLIGAGIVAIHFANKLRKFVFNNRERWNTYIYNKLGGNK